MGKRKDTKKNIKYSENLLHNMDKIVNRYANSRAEFYGRYLYPYTEEYTDDLEYCKNLKMKPEAFFATEEHAEANRQNMNRLLGGSTKPTYEQLLIFSEVAGISINELLTEKINIEDKSRSLRDILMTLLVLLDRMYFKLHKVTSKGITGYIIAPRLKPTNVNDSEYNGYVFGSIVNEFLKEYEEQKRKAPEDYRAWRKQILRGAYGYTVDGCKVNGVQPLPEIAQIVERAKESRRKAAAEAQKQADHEAAEEREQWLETHIFYGYTREEWDAMTEEEREEIHREQSYAQLDAMEELEKVFPEDQEPEGTIN